MSTVSLGKHHVLTLNRLRKLSTANKEFYPDFEAAAKSVLDNFQQAMHFDAAWILKFDPNSFNILDIFLHQFCQKAFSKYLDAFYNKTPIPTIRQIKNEGFISKRGSDLIENVTWVENPFYRNIIQPLGLKFFLTVACINDKHEHVGLILLWRSETRHDFSTRDCFFLEKASAPCASILELTDKSKKDAERPEILRLITQRSYPGVVVLGERNEIAYINREAKNIMSIFKSGREQLSRSVEEIFLDKLRDLRTKILQKDSVSIQGNGASLPIETFTFRGTTFSCRGIPLEGNGGSENLVMILIESVKEEEDGLPVFNNRLSNFTAREGAVARLVSQGFTNKEIASELGIGVHTVKDHIKNIMGKLRTNTRSGIVAKIMVG